MWNYFLSEFRAIRPSRFRDIVGEFVVAKRGFMLQKFVFCSSVLVDTPQPFQKVGYGDFFL